MLVLRRGPWRVAVRPSRVRRVASTVVRGSAIIAKVEYPIREYVADGVAHANAARSTSV